MGTRLLNTAICHWPFLLFHTDIILTIMGDTLNDNASSVDLSSCGKGINPECVEHLSSVLKIDPNQGLLYFQLGNELRALGKWEATASAYEFSAHNAERSGDIPLLRTALLWLGKTYIELGMWGDAIVQFDRLVSMQRNVILPEALYRLLYLQHFACNFTERATLLREAKETVSWELSFGTSKMTPSQALMLMDGPLLHQLAIMFAKAHIEAAVKEARDEGPWVWALEDFLHQSGAAVSAYAAFSPQHLVITDGRLKLGYLSKDFGFSSVGQLLPRLFSAHDRRRFRVTAYSLGQDDGTWYHREVAEGAQRFVSLADRPPSEVAAAINSDSVNIIVDLSGHLSVAAQGALALQPAPIAVSYLAWLSSSGAPYIQACPPFAPPDFRRVAPDGGGGDGSGC